jgi:hypothetical protein
MNAGNWKSPVPIPENRSHLWSNQFSQGIQQRDELWVVGFPGCDLHWHEDVIRQGDPEHRTQPMSVCRRTLTERSLKRLSPALTAEYTTPAGDLFLTLNLAEDWNLGPDLMD